MHIMSKRERSPTPPPLAPMELEFEGTDGEDETPPPPSPEHKSKRTRPMTAYEEIMYNMDYHRWSDGGNIVHFAEYLDPATVAEMRKDTDPHRWGQHRQRNWGHDAHYMHMVNSPPTEKLEQFIDMALVEQQQHEEDPRRVICFNRRITVPWVFAHGTVDNPVPISIPYIDTLLRNRFSEDERYAHARYAFMRYCTILDDIFDWDVRTQKKLTEEEKDHWGYNMFRSIYLIDPLRSTARPQQMLHIENLFPRLVLTSIPHGHFASAEYEEVVFYIQPGDDVKYDEDEEVRRDTFYVRSGHVYIGAREDKNYDYFYSIVVPDPRVTTQFTIDNDSPEAQEQWQQMCMSRGVHWPLTEAPLPHWFRMSYNQTIRLETDRPVISGRA